MKTKLSGLYTRNLISQVAEEDYLQLQDYLAVVQSLARLTYQSIYIIDYLEMKFDYVSDNPLFLCGYDKEEVLKLGYDFYLKNVAPEDLVMLNIINEAGFDFFEKLPTDQKKLYSITYDFNLINERGEQVLINHKLTPMFLTGDGKLWKSICIVSISHHQQAGNIFIYKEGADTKWELDINDKTWHKSEKPKLSGREVEVLRLYAQGQTIKQIAERLVVSVDTVKYYRRRIFEALQVNSIVEALSYATSNKII